MAEQRALAAAAPAHNHECLAAIDPERNIVDHRAIPESSDKIDNLDDGRVRRHGKKNDEIRMTKHEGRTKLE